GAATPKRHFTIGIDDDVAHSSLRWDPDESIDTDPDVVRAVFFGLGSDGTVGANKQTIKIIGECTDHHVQGYFVYDSKKAGAVTISHLRFGPRPIRSAYLIEDGRADFVAVHNARFLERYEVLRHAKPGATVLLNVEWPAREVFQHLPRELQQEVLDKRLELWAIDASGVAERAGLGRRINTVMQACFFELSRVMPRAEALDAIRRSIRKSYHKRGAQVVEQNLAAVDAALAGLESVPIPTTADGSPRPSLVADDHDEFVRRVTGPILAGHGDALPVSAMPIDGTFPTGTARLEKRRIADRVPEWDRELCIQCAKCAIVCPHAAIRVKVFDASALDGAPAGFESAEFRGSEHAGMLTTIQVAPDDCTGCELCVHVCPAKDKSEPRHKAIDMTPVEPRLARERENFEFFLGIPEIDRTAVQVDNARDSQLLEPLFEFSGACAGCGETPYLKLLSQLFGDRLLVANATGCSSIYGGNLPTTPWSKNRDGRGPAWSNSLFEDAAEFGLGFRLTLDEQAKIARRLLEELSRMVGKDLADAILASEQYDEAEYREQRARIDDLRLKLRALDTPEARRLESIADALVRKSSWIVGGDGWAYDIGFGGLDHALASGRDVNILVLDTEVYSNTGGQMSKSTPRAALAKFAAAGKPTAKKDIGMIAMAHDHVYVAQVALGASDKQTVRAFVEADRYPGPSLIIAYSHCIAHGLHMADGMLHQKLAVDCGHWPLYRYDPTRLAAGENPLQLDSRAPKIPFQRFAERESRFHMLTRSRPETAKRLQALAQQDIDERWNVLRQMAAMEYQPEEIR
ncbi:MAG: pyruvate:ferredoxin (flavodoxin) oxidoreductase, partial [Planctomycetes bacterium]|nr:pyruvate:ferredoxin (flavodoxin) oxidoreductase [Planctomycetota bacterium]